MNIISGPSGISPSPSHACETSIHDRGITTADEGEYLHDTRESQQPDEETLSIHGRIKPQIYADEHRSEKKSIFSLTDPRSSA